MIERYEETVLIRDLLEKGLKAGDIGTVVEIHDDAGYSLEFFGLAGETFAVATVSADATRSTTSAEILHVRRIEESAAG